MQNTYGFNPRKCNSASSMSCIKDNRDFSWETFNFFIREREF